MKVVSQAWNSETLKRLQEIMCNHAKVYTVLRFPGDADQYRTDHKLDLLQQVQHIEHSTMHEFPPLQALQSVAPSPHVLQLDHLLAKCFQATH